MEERDQEKKDRLLAALDKGMVMVHLDARRPGVDVPESLRREAHLRLNLSYKFDPPDLSVTAWGVRATLSFSGRRYPVAVPWSALFAVTSHVSREFWMYPDDMPEELLQSPQPRPKGEGPGQGAPLAHAGGPRRVVLQEVKGGKDEDGDRESEGAGDGPTGPELPAAAAEPSAASAPPASVARPPSPAPVPSPTPPAEEPGEAREPSGPPDGPERPKGRGHLRLVK